MKNARECFRFENGYYTYTKKYDGMHGVAFAFDELDAAKMLGEEIPREKLVSEYLKVSTGNGSSQKIHAIISLARLGGERALSRIIELTAHLDDDVRAVAIDGLCHFPDDKRALDKLIMLLKEKNPVTRKVSAEALGRLGNKEALPALRSELRKSLSSRRLWKVGGILHRNEFAEYVLSLFRSMLKLGELQVLSEIVPLLLHAEAGIVEDAASLLFQYKTQDEVILGTVLRYIRNRQEPDIINSIYDISAKSKDRTFLKAALHFRNRCVRGQAVKNLGNTKWVEGQRTLLEYLEKGTDFEILLFILESQHVQSVHVDHLTYILREALAHQWPTVRFKAARQLRLLPPGEARKLAEEALPDEPDHLVKKALQTIISKADCTGDMPAARQDSKTGNSACKCDYKERIPAGQSDRSEDIPLFQFNLRSLQVQEQDGQEKSLLKLRCSFCGVDQRQADRLIMKHRESSLISGPNVGICNFCIAILNKIVEDSSLLPPVAQKKIQGKCSFCDRQIHYSGSLLTGPDVKICVECLELCNKVLKDKSGDNQVEARAENDNAPGDNNQH